MIYKVFYQETKERNPRREQTKSLYLDIDAEMSLQAVSKLVKLLKITPPTTSNTLSFFQKKLLNTKRKQACLK